MEILEKYKQVLSEEELKKILDKRKTTDFILDINRNIAKELDKLFLISKENRNIQTYPAIQYLLTTLRNDINYIEQAWSNE